MRRSIGYGVYADKVRGCFLGKTVIGTLGAPYEGVKMPMELPFRNEMVNTMLPNDDLDLQVLWLDVVEKHGLDFTSALLQQAFAENCDYSPGEYAIMRKNYHKRIYPPYSGEFCNDYYIEGMGCPIRSEIWACLAPGAPEAAAELASRDGILDHKGESVYAERFFAAMEAEAFFESDMFVLIETGLSVIPEDCKFRSLVEDVVGFCRRHADIKAVLADILFKYGHPDCTNMFQNMGITLAALILGDTDIIKTGMAALNCGFDTDCTCASAGALLGIILGEKELVRQYGWKDVRYVLGVRSHRRSDRVSDLSDDIALLGAALAGELAGASEITGAPKKRFDFEPRPAIEFAVDYENGDPSAGIGSDCTVSITVKNNTEERMTLADVKVTAPETMTVKKLLLPDGASEDGSITIIGNDGVRLRAVIGVAEDCRIIYERNIVKLTANVSLSSESDCTGKPVCYEFGVSGNKLWKLTGPIWKTSPATDEKVLGDKIGYFHIFTPGKNRAETDDAIRLFHLNFASDAETDYFSADELFAPTGTPEDIMADRVSRGGRTLFARPYKETTVQTKEDSFELGDFMGFKGPCVAYLSQILGFA